MKQLPIDLENIGPNQSVSPRVNRTLADVVSSDWWANVWFRLDEHGWGTYGAWMVPVIFVSAIAAGVSQSWWTFAAGISLYAAIDVLLHLRTRQLERRDPCWRSMRKLRERSHRISSALTVFQLHCGIYREWHREVTLGLHSEDGEQADRYYDLLIRARRVLEGAIIQTIFLGEQIRKGHALLDAGSTLPSITLELEKVDAPVVEALRTGDDFDPSYAFRCEEAVSKVLDELRTMQTLPSVLLEGADFPAEPTPELRTSL